MKKLVLLLVSVILFSCNSDNEYKKKANETIKAMNALITVCDASCEHYISIWQGVIFDGWYGEEKCNDFNYALSKEAKKMQEKGLTTQREKDFLDSKYKEIKDVPNSCKEQHDELIRLYVMSTEYAELADSPTGSLKSYVDKTRELKENLTNGIKQFTLKYPADK